MSVGGAIARDQRGNFLGGFWVDFGEVNVLRVELLFIMIAIENTVEKD